MSFPRFAPWSVCVLSAFLFAAAASAQVIPPLPRFTPPPLPDNVDPGPDNGTPEKADVRLQFPNAQVTDILDQYQQLSGKHVIPNNKVNGAISLVVNTPVTRTEAIKLIEVALSLNGFLIVPGEGDILKVVGVNDNPRTVGVPIFFDLSLVPDSDQIVAFVARLHYIDPLETAGVLQQFVPPNNTVAFNAIPKSGALIITDAASHLKQLVALISQIDLPPATVVEKFFKLERADATKAVEFLNSAFELKASNTPGQPSAPIVNPNINPGIRRPIRRIGVDDPQFNEQVGLPGFASSASTDFAIQGRITLTADVRTNRVHVVTSPVNIPRIQRLLEEYDADTPFAQPVKRPLRFVSAREILPILVQALSEPGSEGANGANGTTPATGSTNPTSRNGSSGFGSSGGFNSNGSSSGGFGGSGGSGGGSSGVGESQLDTEPVDTTPTEATVGNTKIIADQRNNTIILLGGTAAKDKVFEIIDQLDVRSPQVIIRTVIGELSIQEGKEFGLNYLLRSNRGSLLSNFNAGQIPTTATSTGGTTTTDPTTGATTTTGGTSTGSSVLNSFSTLATGLAGVSSNFAGVGGIITIGKSFDIILSALNSTNRFKTISRPMIFTSNNKKAIIASGQEIAVPTSQVGSTTGSTAGTVGTYTNVDYKDVTLQLEVVPLINSDHEITLDILQKIDSVVAGSSTVVNGTSVPTIATRYLKSTVSAPNNSTVVLGGLITQDVSHTSNDIPYLSKIPLLGDLLFKSRTDSAARNELIILMHPEVVDTDKLLRESVPKEEDRTYIGRDPETQLLPMEVRKAIPVNATPAPTPRYHRERVSNAK